MQRVSVRIHIYTETLYQLFRLIVIALGIIMADKKNNILSESNKQRNAWTEKLITQNDRRCSSRELDESGGQTND